MLSHGRELAVVLFVVALATSSVGGAVLAGSGPQAASAGTAQEITSAASAQEGNGELNASTECAATPSEDGADPNSDVTGWESGVWYTESIDVNQDDGVQKDERKQIVARTMARVEAIRCIEFEESVPMTLISRKEYRQQQLERNTSEGLRKFDNVKFEALFLISESDDSLEVQRRNRGASVLGYYDPRKDEIVVVAESAETLRIDELTLAHELIHAWQDQQYNLSGPEFRGDFRDEVNAIDSVVEGDARLVDIIYRRLCSQNWNCLEGRPGGGGGDLANVGVFLMKFHPYSDGPAFVRMIRAIGGWDAVTRLYSQLPNSTEQVIHPQRYRTDEPTNVTLNDTATDSWSRVRPPKRASYGELGESALLTMLLYPTFHSQGQTTIIDTAQIFNYNETGNITNVDPYSYESNYTTGWDGDRLHVYENEAGKFGYVWKLAWDSPQDAQQFVSGYEKVLRYWGAEEIRPSVWRIQRGGFADAFYVDVEGTTVTIVNAPRVQQLTEIRPDIGPIAVGNATEGDGGTGNETTTTA